jgi:hypothetical protein
MNGVWSLAVNLFEHARLRVGFMLAERQDRRVLEGDALIDAIGREWGGR